MSELDEVLQPSTDIEDKLRVLCLHGYRQNGDTFKSKTGSLRKFLGKYAEFIYLDAPHLAAPLNPGDEEIKEQRSWWSNKDDGTFKGTNKGGPAVGFEESLRLVEGVWKSQGPFHGLLGFSQGACFVGLICGFAEKKMTSIKPTFAILASGFMSGSLVHKNAYEEIVNIPSLHIYGLTDEIIVKDMSVELSHNFQDCQIVEHNGGHYFPATAQQKEVYVQFFQDRLQEHLENVEIQSAKSSFLDECDAEYLANSDEESSS